MRTGQQGTTLIEVATVLALVGVGIGVTAFYVVPPQSPLQLGVERTEGALRQARLQALASQSAHRVRPLDSGRLGTEVADRCDAGSWSAAPDLTVAMPAGVTVSTGWDVCFGARGIADANVTVAVDDGVAPPRSVEVMLGGTTRVAP